MGSAAQANPGFSGLAAQVEPVEKKDGKIRNLPPRSNPLGKLEYAAQALFYYDSRVLRETVSRLKRKERIRSLPLWLDPLAVVLLSCGQVLFVRTIIHPA